MLALIYKFLILLAAENTAAGESGYDKFVHFWNTYFNYPGFELWRFLNLAIFTAIMIYLLRKPLSEAFKAKREKIRADLIKAEAERQSALAKLTSTEAKLAVVDAETAAVIENARQTAVEEKTRIYDQTDFEVGKMREQADNEIEVAAKQAQNRLRRFSAEESIRLAEEKIKSEINAEKDARLIKANIQAIGGLN